MNNPDDMGPPNEPWMLLTPEGPEFFETEDEAREEAEAAIEDYRLDGEHDLAEMVLVARVVAYAKAKTETHNIEIFDDEESEDVSRDVEYELADVPFEGEFFNNGAYRH